MRRKGKARSAGVEHQLTRPGVGERASERASRGIFRGEKKYNVSSEARDAGIVTGAAR